MVTLIKPHYEADSDQLVRGVLPEVAVEGVVDAVKRDIENGGFTVLQTVRSPIIGSKGNVEVLALRFLTVVRKIGRSQRRMQTMQFQIDATNSRRQARRITIETVSP